MRARPSPRSGSCRPTARHRARACRRGSTSPCACGRTADAPPLTRSYSLSDLPGERGYRISVKREGEASRYLHEHVKVGDLLDAAAPRGSFVLRDGTRPVVLLSAGVGATPVLAMLHALAREHEHEAGLVGARGTQPRRPRLRRRGRRAARRARRRPPRRGLQPARRRGGARLATTTSPDDSISRSSIVPRCPRTPTTTCVDPRASCGPSAPRSWPAASRPSTSRRRPSAPSPSTPRAS